ncbi:MATE family efflux transporter [Clostridium grantii]|uniref:Probable multidrug resistance protein NorM n=1 Tax=Clostridium grantii DSM 8605 TaxID=1121316 RepID=A0A1M5T2R1_9CLOT|nr:MATE family efflux transporter [Clostridium grantii]SHH44978.1 putative efflux protein, MATE family [Clostridium grantii DSM 8605]
MASKVENRRELILEGNLWKVIMVLAVPVAINDLILGFYNLIDAFFVASIGTMEIAAITFVGPLNMFVQAISVGLGVGGTNLIAREIGKKDYDKAKNVSMQLLIISTMLGILIAMVAFIFSKQILVAASATEGIMELSDIYFKLTVLSSPFVFINSAYISIKRAEGDTLKTMRLNMISMGIKVIFTYIMIYHLNMGIKSLAISTIIGTMFVSCYGFYDLFIRESLVKLSFANFKFTKQVLVALFIISIPIIIEKSSISFSFIVMNKYVIGYSEKVMAGYGITNRINTLFFALVTGFGTGLSPIISQNLAIKQEKRVLKAIRNTFIITISISVILISIVLPLRYALAGLFANGDSEVLYHTVNAMGVYSISVIPWALFQVTNGVFQGTGQTHYNMIISIMRIYCFRLPIVIALTKFTNLAEYSIWYGMLFSNILTGVFALILYFKNRNKLRLVGEKN